MKKQPDKGKITALYERLSHDDERAGESVSIENQKRILEDYAQKNGFTNIRHFTDDGVRGTTFKRPGLDAMLEEIRAGNVATVIIKDQSRIGRDVVEVGLLKRTFDEYHVRFIAANDNLDTANGFDIMSIFRDVINEWYVADTSRKIKTVFKSRMEKGLRCSGSVSYGYLASKENKGEWVIDEEAAAVVRRIFHSVVAGESIASIARALRAEKIPIPSEHWKRIGAPVRSAKYTDPYAWSTTTISYILKRPEYTGRKVLGKTVCENYKTKSTRKTAPEEQYIFDGEIPAIVLSGIFLLPVTMQSHQIKISRNRKQIQQCAVENGTLFSCISFRTRYDESVTKKKERTPSRQRHCSLLRSLLRSNRSRSSMLMIRRFSIFCKLNEIKFSDRKWFEDAAGMPLPPDQPCPYCLSKGTLRLFGHYNRYLVEWDGNTQKCSTVTVQRHICDSCGHTHAILPSCIVPYRSYSLRFLLLVLRAYFTRPGSVEGLCDHYGITISMLYRWLRLFQQQKALWLGMLEDLFVPAVPFIDAMDVTLLKEFFLAFRFSYLESPRVTDPEMPPRKQQHPGSIT